MRYRHGRRGGVGVGFEVRDAELRYFSEADWARERQGSRSSISARAAAAAAAAEDGGEGDCDGMVGDVVVGAVHGGDGVAPPAKAHEREVRFLHRAQRGRRLDVERAEGERGGAVRGGERERAQVDS